ncbi:MAG: hypothetical protein ACYS0E_09850, partial [Planctomycetota bacterium]
DDFASRASKFMDDAEEPLLLAVNIAAEGVTDFRDLSRTLRKDWSDDVKPRVTGALDEATGLIAESRPTLKSLLQKLDDAGSLASETLIKIQDLSVELRGTVAESRPHLISALRSASEGMANFKDATHDLKVSPWKLLNKPSGKEVATVFFFDAAKLQAEAAREVRAAVDDLQTLERLGALQDEKSQEAVARATERLQEAAAKLRAQEDAIAEALKSKR